MKKLLFFYIILIILIVIAYFIKSNGLNFPQKYNSRSITINGKKFNLLIAKSPEEKAIGLSKNKNLAKDAGMIFVFNEKGYYPFWMKNMKFPIDIIFIDDKTVTDVYKNIQPPNKNILLSDLPIIKPTREINYVLEINSGLADTYKINPGDKAEMANIGN